MKNADNALLDARGFATPEAAQAWAKEAGDASVYRIAGRDSGGAVKALEPVKPQTQLQSMPAGSAHGNNKGNMLRWKPGEAIPEGKAASVGETGGFVDGLDEGMGGLKDVKKDAPEGIDFAAEEGKAGREGEYKNIQEHIPGIGDAESESVLSLSTRFLNKMDPMWKNSGNIKPIEGFQDIVCHGDKLGFSYKDLDGNEINLSAREFADILKNSPVYEGRPIRLISCNAGANDSITAQYLADYLGVDVLAPTKTVYVYPDGTIKIGSDNSGQWIQFKPKER